MGTQDGPLVGRDDELARAVRAVARGRGALLLGSAGVGRTRLLGAVAAAVDGRPVHRATGGRQLATQPLGAFGSPAGDLRGALAALALPHDAVVVVDDAHWLDPASLALVEHLLVHTRTSVLLAARRRSDGAVALQELARRRGLATIVIEPLETAHLRHLRRGISPDGDEEAGRAAEEAAAGRPRLLRAVLAGAEPGEVRADLVADELDLRDDDERAVVEMVAVAGTLPIELAEAVGDGAAAAALERRGVLVALPDAGGWALAFADALHGRTVREGLGPAAVRLRARQVLAEMAPDPPTDPAARVRQAVLRTELGDRSDPDLLVAAAADLLTAANTPDTAETRALAGGLEQAVVLAEAALEAGAGFAAAETLTRIHSHRLDTHNLAPALRTLADLATTDELRARAVAVAGANDLLNDADPEQAYQDVTAAVGDDDQARRVLSTVIVIAALGSGRTAEAVAVGEQVLADPLTTRAERLSLIGVLAAALASVGRAVDALALVDGAVSDIGPGDDPTALAGLVGARITCLAHVGRYDEAGQMAEQALGVAQALGGGASTALASLALAFCHLVRGRLVDATVAAQRTLSIGPAELGRRPAAAALARARAHRGDRAGAEEAVAVLDSVPARFAFLALEEARALAWVALGRGDRQEAVRILREAAARDAPECPPTAANALFDLVRMGDASGADELAVLAGRTQDPVTPVYAAHARALADDDGTALEEVAERHAALGALLFAAEAASQAAQAHDRVRRGADAARAAAGSAEWAERCQGARTPALQRPRTDLGALTRREREVAELAAEGLGDRAIAERLTLSVRTVESHLHRAYTKLAVTNRVELRTLLASSP